MKENAKTKQREITSAPMARCHARSARFHTAAAEDIHGVAVIWNGRRVGFGGRSKPLLHGEAIRPTTRHPERSRTRRAPKAGSHLVRRNETAA